MFGPKDQIQHEEDAEDDARAEEGGHQNVALPFLTSKHWKKMHDSVS